MSSIVLRTAVEADTPLILQFIRDLADYERLSADVVATEATLREALFGKHPGAEVVLAERTVAGVSEPLGFALFFHNFSTFLSRRGLYLEDLFVRPSARGLGVGKALLQHLASLAVERGCGRFEWSVLDWNETAIRFYRALGANAVDGWHLYRLTGAALEKLAEPAP